MEKFVEPPTCCYFSQDFHPHILIFLRTPPGIFFPYILFPSPTPYHKWNSPNVFFNLSLTWFHKISHISAKNSPILKIKNLACSVLRCRSSGRQNDDAPDVTREDVAKDVTKLRTSI